MVTSVWKFAETLMASDASITEGDSSDRREERAWLDRCAVGDERAIRWVLNRYRDRVVRLAAHVLHNPREAEDVAQEAFVKAFRQIGQFRGESGFYAWLYRIVINLCLDRLRRKCMTAETPLEESGLPCLVAVTPDMEKRLAVEQVLVDSERFFVVAGVDRGLRLVLHRELGEHRRRPNRDVGRPCLVWRLDCFPPRGR